MLVTCEEFKPEVATRLGQRTHLFPQRHDVNKPIQILARNGKTEILNAIRNDYAVSALQSLGQTFLWGATADAKQNEKHRKSFHQSSLPKAFASESNSFGSISLKHIAPVALLSTPRQAVSE